MAAPRSHLFVIPNDLPLNDSSVTNSSLTRDRYIRTPRASYLPERSTTPSRPVWTAKRPSWGGGIIAPDIASRSQSTGRIVNEHDLSESWQVDKHFLMAMIKEMQTERANLSARLDSQLAAVKSANEQIQGLHQQQDQLRALIDDKDNEIRILKQCQNDPEVNTKHQEQRLQNRVSELTESLHVLSERLKTMAEINRNLRLQVAELNAKISQKHLVLQKRWTAATVIQKYWRRWLQQQRYKDMIYDLAVHKQTQSQPQSRDISDHQRRADFTKMFTLTLTVGVLIMFIVIKGRSSS